ncbi:MAG: hypothetical protein M5U23_02600 [Acidimicrobiia bacterium]|nr:hypothetical protein [Acidimicrobiia bacterium]
MDGHVGVHRFFDEIEGAIRAELYYVALFSALTIPDHMAALASPNGLTTGKKYRRWYRENVTYCLTAEDCYLYRCRMLHEAAAELKDESTPTARVAFTEPGGGVVDCVRVGELLIVHVPTLCSRLIDAARTWLESKVSDEVVQANLSKTVRRYGELKQRGVSIKGEGSTFVY